MSALLLSGALLTAVLACVLLALSQQRHWQAVTGNPSEPRRLPRHLGALLLTVSIGLAILRDGASFAALFLPVMFGAAALITAMVLTWAPHVLRPIARLIAHNTGN
jgi:hypothetical protein